MDASNGIVLLKILGGLISGFFLEYNGILMVQQGITSKEAITLTLFSFQVTSIDLGIIVVSLGVLLQIMTIRHRFRSEKSIDGDKIMNSIVGYM